MLDNRSHESKHEVMKVQRIQYNLKPIKKHLRVAAYARVSVDYEATEHSMDNQVSYFINKINSNASWEFAGVYTDLGISGTKADREGFASLLNDARKKKIDLILTKSISRFARNTVTLLSTVRELKDLGIGVIFERENINTLSKEGELLLTLLASFAQEESRSISENVKWSIRKRFEQGIPNNVCLYGYRWTGDEFIIEEKEAEVVRFIFSSYLNGDSPDRIASLLRELGIKGPRGNDFSYSKVCDTLRCENYTGDTILQKTYRENHISHKCLFNDGKLPQYFVEEAYPSLIDKETFRKVQEEIARRAEKGYWCNTTVNFNPFTSLIVCSSCGKTYRRKLKDNRHVWICSTKHEKGSKTCNCNNVPEHLLYSLTEEVLGTEFDRALFDRTISRIEVEDKALRFLLRDGSDVLKPWKKDKNGHILKEAVNG